MELLHVVIDLKDSLATLKAYFGKDYVSHFGNGFYNTWINMDSASSVDSSSEILYQNLNTPVNTPVNSHFELIKICITNSEPCLLVRDVAIGDCRISQFYVQPKSVYINHSGKRHHRFFKKITPIPVHPSTSFTVDETAFWNNIGVCMLNLLLNFIVVSHWNRVNIDSIITLEASGENMIGLVEYYKRLGFLVCRSNPKNLQLEIKDLCVNMYGKLDVILQNSEFCARTKNVHSFIKLSINAELSNQGS